MDTLRTCVTSSDLRTALNSLPRTLDATYDRILQNIQDIHREKVHRILKFLSCSARPLLLGELAEVVTVDMDTKGMTRYVPGNRLRRPADVLTICGSLVSLSAARDDFYESLGGGYHWLPMFSLSESDAARVVQLSHFSVQEYLFSERIREGRAHSFSIDSELAHRWIAATCLAYLMRFDNLVGLDKKQVKENLDSGLALYAARHWIWHLQHQGQDSDSSLQRSVQELFQQPRQAQFLNWVRIHDIESWHPPCWLREGISIPEPLYYACSARLTKVSKWLLNQGVEVNTKGGRFGNALQVASFHGDESIVWLLLDRGTEVNVRGGVYGSALQAASVGGHESVVRLLLNKGANINVDGGMFGSALQAASVNGHETVVQLLLDRGAEVEVGGGVFGSALQAASVRGHESVVGLLLDRGAKLNKQGGKYGSTLQAACKGGDESVVRLLLDRGAEVNAQGGQYGSALQVASLNSHQMIVQLLLDRGAEVNAEGGNMGAHFKRRLLLVMKPSCACCSTKVLRSTRKEDSSGAHP